MYINGIYDKDNAMINLLLKDARMSYSAIGAAVDALCAKYPLFE